MSTLERFVTRNGRRFKVESLPPKDRPHMARKREAELFAKVPLLWAAAATKAIGSPRAFVPIWLRHMAWKSRSETFALSNADLARYGVDRQVKRRALKALTEAGLIKVEQLPGRATIVTLLDI